MESEKRINLAKDVEVMFEEAIRDLESAKRSMNYAVLNFRMIQEALKARIKEKGL